MQVQRTSFDRVDMSHSHVASAPEGTFLTEVQVQVPQRGKDISPVSQDSPSPPRSQQSAPQQPALTQHEATRSLREAFRVSPPSDKALARSKARQEAAVAAANAHEAHPQLTSAYYAHLPFQPGVDSLLWLALQSSTQRGVRGFNVPSTLISDGQETAWLRTKNTYTNGTLPSLSVRMGGNLDRWLFRFRSACVADSGFDMALAAQLASARLEAQAAAQGMAARLARKAEQARVSLRSTHASTSPGEASRSRSTDTSPRAAGKARSPRPVRFNFNEEDTQNTNKTAGSTAGLSPAARSEEATVKDTKGRRVTYAWAATPHARATGGGSTRSITSQKQLSPAVVDAVDALREAGLRKRRPRAKQGRQAPPSPETQGGASLLRGARHAARQADAGADLRTVPLAVLRSPAPWTGACRSDCSVLTAASFASRLLSADKAKFVAQAFVKSRGRHPLTYRVTWRKQGPAKVLALHLGGCYLFSPATRRGGGRPVQPTEEVEDLLAPVEGGSLEGDGGGGSAAASGMSRVGDVTPEEERELTRALVVSTTFASDDAIEAAAAAARSKGGAADGQGGGLDPVQELAAASTGVFSASRMTGQAVREPVELTEQFVRLVCSSVPAAWGWASSDSQHSTSGATGGDLGFACGIEWLTADWLRDDAGKWWFAQVKAFKLTPAAEHTAARIRSVLRWAAEHPVGLDRWLDPSGLGRRGPSTSSKGGRGGGKRPANTNYGAVPTQEGESSSDEDGTSMPTQQELQRLRGDAIGGAAGASGGAVDVRERVVQSLNAEATQLLKGGKGGVEGATGRSAVSAHAATSGPTYDGDSDSDLSDDAMFTSSLAAAHALVRGGVEMEHRTDTEQRRMALRTRSLVRSLGYETLGDVPDDGQLHLAAAGGLKHVRKGGALSSAVKALAVNSRQCHLCRLRFTPRESMPAFETYLREADALARQLVAEGGGVVPAQRVTYTGAAAGGGAQAEAGGGGGWNNSVVGGSSSAWGGHSVQSVDEAAAPAAVPVGARRPASAFSRLQAEGGAGGLDTTQLREAGMADAVGRLREGNEWRGQIGRAHV